MEFKGTKGKWEFKKEYEAEFIKLYIIDEEEDILFDSGSRSYLEEETEFNFKVASKAPEMLEILQKMVYECQIRDVSRLNEIKQLIKEATEL